MPIRTIREFIKLESAGGLLLIVAALLALLLDNSPFSRYYQLLLSTHFSIALGDLALDKPLILWINEGLMAIFFFLVGLEIKREMLIGELNSFAKLSLPTVAAIGGMVVPALIYTAFNYDNRFAMHGWAIPTATDIAFALGLLSLLGSRAPVSLKIFLTALSILDDIGAIIIIAFFYTARLSLLALGLSSLCLLILFAMNRLRITSITPYALIGALLWLFVLKSGVHATLAGVVLAFCIPLEGPHEDYSPLRHLEGKLHPWVVFLVLPLFAFANAGISFQGLHLNHLFGPIPVGIALGLFLGKQLGVFGASWICIKSGWAKMPAGANTLQLYGVSLICGVGFTMSLFIGTLAFSQSAQQYTSMVRFGVMVGSLFSGLIGYLILRFIPKS